MGGNSPNHILVIRLSALGDVAMTVPVLSALCTNYPAIRITVLTKPFFQPIFSRLPEQVSVFPADIKHRHKGVRGLWRMYGELCKMEIDMVADLHNVLRSNILKTYFQFGGIPVVQLEKGRREKKAITRRRKKVFKPLMSTFDRYAEVFARMNLPIPLTQARPLPRETLPDRLRGWMAPQGRMTLGIAPFAAHVGKVYPEKLMREVLQLLDDTKRYKILLFGGGALEAKKLKAWSGALERVDSIAGKLDFDDELKVISNLDAMVSMDSGNAHLAAMYGVPTVTLWGVTHPYTGFYPFNQDLANALLADRGKFPEIPTSVYGDKLPQGYERAMETIRPEAVVQKVLALTRKDRREG